MHVMWEPMLQVWTPEIFETRRCCESESVLEGNLSLEDIIDILNMKAYLVAHLLWF